MHHRDPALLIEAVQDSDGYVVRLGGELDLGGCLALEYALEEAERSDATRILLDLEGLEFTDASGLGVLVRAGHRSARYGNRLQITRGTGQVARVLRITALEDALPIVHRIPIGHA